jgi:hypothetical protein
MGHCIGISIDDCLKRPSVAGMDPETIEVLLQFAEAGILDGIKLRSEE